MEIEIRPYGIFEIVYVGEPNLDNCKLCWFYNNRIHCPNQYACHTKDGNIVFVKLEEEKPQ